MDRTGKRAAFAAASFLLLGAMGPFDSGQWRIAAVVGEAPQRILFLIDTGAIARSGTDVTYQELQVLEAPDASGDSVHLENEGRCGEGGGVASNVTYYARGEPVGSRDEDLDGPARSAAAYGVLEALEVACGERPWLGEGSARDAIAAARAWFAANPR